MTDGPRFGLKLPAMSMLAGGPALLAAARAAERVGFDSVWVADHIALPASHRRPYPYTADGRLPIDVSWPVLDAIAALSAVAAATSSVKLGTSVIPLPCRQPVLLARQVATIDAIAGPGRIAGIGVGTGWLEEEFAAAGAPPFVERGRVTDEAIAVMNALFRGEEVPTSSYFCAQGLKFSPRPSVSPPIWIGGHSRAAIRRLARMGDGWVGTSMDFGLLPALVRDIHDALEEHGRDPSSVTLSCGYEVSAQVPTTTRPAQDRLPADPSELADRLGWLGEVGLDLVEVRMTSMYSTDLDKYVDDIAWFGETFIGEYK